MNATPTRSAPATAPSLVSESAPATQPRATKCRARHADYDAIVVGAGPNGLAAAIGLAQRGLRVLVYEGSDTIGGGTRTKELTLPGFHHDVCSSVHPLGIASPFFQGLPLAEHGIEWLVPEVSAAHPLADGSAMAAYLSLDETVAHMGRDGAMYRRFLQPMLDNLPTVLPDLLGPVTLPSRPWYYVRTGALGLVPAALEARLLFREEQTRAYFCGMAAHSILPLDHLLSAAYGQMMLLMAHSVGWPVARGGSHVITNVLAEILTSLGGEIITGCMVTSMAELPKARAVLFDTTPRQLLKIAGEYLPPRYQRALRRFRLGAGVYKVDYALNEMIPWRNEACRRSTTVHLGGSMQEIVASERAVGKGRITDRPFVILTQPSVLDQTRAPAGKHTAWAYCHVPNGANVNMLDAIEAQIERYAPGFRDVVLARHTMNAAEMEAYNPNYLGGDINGGIQDLVQHFARPVLSSAPYRTPAQGIYLCSSSTPPGGGVHGMCGYHAANTVLHDIESGAI